MAVIKVLKTVFLISLIYWIIPNFADKSNFEKNEQIAYSFIHSFSVRVRSIACQR